MSRPTSDERKASILDAVVRIIIDVGFTEMTVAHVAKLAGVSTSLVHYHFSSKADLIAAALQVASEDDKHFRETNARGSGRALDRLDAVLCGSLPENPDDPSWLLWIESWGETRRRPAIRRVMSDLNAHEVSIVVSLIEEGVAAGEFECDDPSGTAQRLAALRDGLAIQHTLFPAALQPGESVGLLRYALHINLGLTRATT